MASLGLALFLVAVGLPTRAEPLTKAQARHTPTQRFGALPTPHHMLFMRTPVLETTDIGQHHYQGHMEEVVGITYTCRAGFLDLDHVRDAADWTAWLQQRFYEMLMTDEASFQMDAVAAPGSLTVQLLVPLGQADKAQWAHPLSLALARRHAFWLLAWHEAATWLGYRTVFFASEQVSAFSYEDTVSHWVGVEIAARAIGRPGQPYDRAMVEALGQALQELGAQPRNTSLLAMEKVRDRWWNPQRSWPSNGLVMRRDLDNALGQRLQPWRVDGVPGCEGSLPLDWPLDELDQLAGGRLAGVVRSVLQPRWTPMDQALQRGGIPAPAGRAHAELVLPEQWPWLIEALRPLVREELGPQADQP